STARNSSRGRCSSRSGCRGPPTSTAASPCTRTRTSPHIPPRTAACACPLPRLNASTRSPSRARPSTSTSLQRALTDVAIATVRERTGRASQIVTLLAVGVPPLGLVSAAGLLWGVALSWVDIALFAVLYVACALGNSVGFHRLFTHKSFETTQWLRGTFAILGSMAMQGPLTQWVTDHRKHHALSDVEGDPPSPHAGHDEGVLGAVKGFAHAHVGWLFTLKGMERGWQYGRDLYEDRLIRRIDRLYLLWVVLTFGLPFLAGYLVG